MNFTIIKKPTEDLFLANCVAEVKFLVVYLEETICPSNKKKYLNISSFRNLLNVTSMDLDTSIIEGCNVDWPPRAAPWAMAHLFLCRLNNLHTGSQTILGSCDSNTSIKKRQNEWSSSGIPD